MTSQEASNHTAMSVIVDFDLMADQMRSRLIQLEDRASSQTRDLQTVASLSQQIATNLNLNDLLPSVVELTKQQFGLYHVHIYLLDDRSENLVMAAGAGDAGRQMLARRHAIALNHTTSIVAQAAREHRAVRVDDVTLSPMFLPNPVLPETRSELAIPMIVGDELLGVLDVQMNKTAYFDDNSVQVQSTLAAQIAIAVKNARAFEQVLEAEARTNAALKDVQDIRSAIDEHSIVAITDQRGTITYVNDRFCEISKYSREELIGQDHRIINSGYHPKEFIRDVWVTIANGNVWKGEFKNRAKDGSYYWVDTTIVPFLNNQGKPYQYIAIRADITDRKNAEEALAKNEAQLQAILNNSSAVIYVKAPNGEYLLVNRRYEELFNLTSDQITGKTDYYIFPKEIADKLREVDRQVIEQGELVEVEEDVSQADGIHTYLTTKFPMRDENGKIYALCGISTDITERKRNEIEIQRRANQLEVVAQVSAEASTSLDIQQLLPQVVELTKERFGLYHAHIYLIDHTGRNLVLTAGAGTVGRRMAAAGRRIQVDNVNSLVARAARERLGIIVNDVTDTPDFLPNPLLPDTRSEMAVPMTVGGQTIGVLDVQSEQVNFFTDEDLRVMSTLAGLIAVSIQNANLFTETQYRLRDLEVTSAVVEFLRSDEPAEVVMENVLIAALEALGAHSAVFYSYDHEHDLWTGFAAAGEGITSEAVQSFNYPGDRHPHGLEAIQTENIVAISNVADYTGFPADLPEMSGVKSVMVLPVFVGQRTTGVIILNYMQQHLFSPAEFSLGRSLSGQVSTGLERRQAEEEIARRAREIETVALVGAEIASNLDIENLLWLVVNLTRDNFRRYHVQLYLYEPEKAQLVLAAGSGETGRELVKQGHNIPYTQENSLVARAARNREIVVINDVTTEPSFLANLLLPDTKAEITIPVMIADQLIGVLDIQDNKLNAFTGTEIQSKSVLANQIAVAIQNARSFQAMNIAREETERIFNSSIDMLGSATFDGYFVRLNPAWERILGYTKDELMAEPFVSFVHPDDAEMTSREAAKIAEGVGTLSFENRYRCKDGSYRWVSWNTAPDYELNLIHFVARDITAAKQAQQQVQLYADVVRNTPLGIQVYHLDDLRDPRTLRLIAANPASQIAGAAPVEETLNKTLQETAPDLPPELMETYATIARDGGNVELGEVRYKDENTPEGIYAVKAFGLPDHNMGLTFEDITVRKQSEEQLEKSRRRSEALAQVSTALNQANDENDIIAAVASVVEKYGVTQSSLSYFHSENDRLSEIEVMALRAGNGEIVPVSSLPITRLKPADYPILPWVQVNPNKLLIFESVNRATNLDEKTRSYVRAMGINSFISIPLRLSDRWLGNVLFNWKDEQVFDDDMLEILDAIRPSIATTIASRRAYVEAEQARRESESRARDLAAVAQVSTQVTTNLSVNELIQQVTDLVKENFNLYHVHIYLLNPENQTLVLAAGAGQAGRLMKDRGHSIPLSAETSIVARAARSRQGIVVNDVKAFDYFLPNPLLPETRAELAVPMIVADQLIGVMDIQSEKVNRFSDKDISINSTMAAQIAIAVQNARSFTELERRAERERATAEQLRELDRLKSQFLANMSHELRTPLNSIIGYAEVLLDGVDGDLEEEAQEDVTAIYDSGKHLLSIINEILDLAKIEAGQMQLDRKKVDLVDFIGEVIRSGQVLLKTKPVALVMDQESPVAPIYADPIRLRQILWNLVSNAVKFTESGSVTVAFGRADDDNVYVRVIDTGIGISEEGQRVIFERFSQVDGSSTRRAGGTGLGLTITQQLVQMHGSEIMVESTLGKGSTFSFTLPVFETEKVM